MSEVSIIFTRWAQHHWLIGHEFEQILGDGEGQGNLACCHPWCCKELDMTEQLNNKSKKQIWVKLSWDKPPLVTLPCSASRKLHLLANSIKSLRLVLLCHSVVCDPATPWTAAHQASVCITNSQSLLRLMSLKSVMPSTISFSVVPSAPAFSVSQNQGLFQWVSSSHQVAKVLELQLQHQSFQWLFRTDFL